MAERLPPAGVMVLGGLILLATFFLPWSLGEPKVFSWEAMRGVEGVRAFWPVVFLVSGFVAIVTSRTRLPSFLRVFGCVLAGLAPVVFVAFFARDAIPFQGTPFGWRVPVGAAGLVLCAVGFIHRRVDDGAFPKLLATLGGVAFLLAFLLPFQGRFLFVEAVEAARDSVGLARVPPFVILAATGLATLSLMTWKPGFLGAWALLVAWLLLLVVPALIVVGGAGTWRQPSVAIYPAANVLALSLLATHGLAAMLARITA